MAASTAVPLSKKSQRAFLEYYRSLQSLQNVTRDTSRSRYERIDREYQRETDLTEAQQRAKAANRSGDADRLQNMTVPVVMPQVESAVVHQTSVFLTGQPIFGVVAAPQFIDEALQLETIFEDNSIRGGWARELMMFFRDGFKYNFSAVEVDWGQEVTQAIVTDVTKSVTQGVAKEIIWSGNRVRRLDPYNTFVDTRVPATEVYKDGEFAGYTEFVSRIKLKSFIAELPDQITANIKPAFESGLGSYTGAKDAGAMNYYIPSVNPDVSEDDYKAGTNWISWACLKDDKEGIQYKDGYELTTLYCKVLPSEFEVKIPKSNTPQIFKLYFVNHEHIIYSELQTNAHNYLPILVGSPQEDGLSYQTKSLADNGAPFQALASGLMNANIASRRRSITDRVLYDPSRISEAHINSANPSAKIPVRPAAYGKQISDAVYQFPYREDQAGQNMQQISTVLGLANTLNGQNQASQGQFVKGNKTLHEFESVMQNANGRDQLTSILLEYQVFIPMKLILKLNTLQFQGGTTVYNRDKDVSVEIDPVKLRTAVLEFRVSDGLVPASKLLNSDSFATALQVFGSSPQIAAEYNVGQLFSYFMKTQGAKITEFEKSPEQVAYEQAMSSWQGLMQLSIEKGADPKAVGPQPLPKDYNYNPQNNKPAPKEQQAPNTQQQGLT